MKASFILLLSIFFFFQSENGYSQIKNRVIILSDIEADPDDAQSFVRLLLYANQIDIKGMIATTSCWQKNRVAPESIKKIIRTYGRIQTNLNKHESGFPHQDSLLSIVQMPGGVPVATVAINNAKNAGMKKEGVLLCHTCKNGEYQNHVIYGIINE